MGDVEVTIYQLARQESGKMLNKIAEAREYLHNMVDTQCDELEAAKYQMDRQDSEGE